MLTANPCIQASYKETTRIRFKQLTAQSTRTNSDYSLNPTRLLSLTTPYIHRALMYEFREFG